MDGTALLDMADLAIATKEHKITPTTEVLNDTAKQYYFLSTMMKGRSTEEIVQNGKQIIDMVRLSKHNAAGFYKPNQTLNPRGMDVLTKLACNWRFHQGNYAWTNEQVRLNGGSSVDNWVKLLELWRQASKQDIWDSLEANLWAVPSNADMEADDGLKPYSLPCFITSNGLAPSGFTTVMGVNPTTQTNWRNQTGSYTAANLATTLYPAFDGMWLDLRWKKPPGVTWATDTNFSKLNILTSKTGIMNYIDQNRSNNDRLQPKNDPGTYQQEPTYNGIPLQRVPELETYMTAASITNPPYIWLDTNFIFPVWHSEVYMLEEDPIRGGTNQPFSWAVYINSYLNFFCRSRKRHGWIAGT